MSTTTIDQLKTIAGRFVQKAKENLIEDGELMPIAVAIKDGDVVSLVALDMDHGASKELAYRSLANFLRRSQADAAIVINDAYMRQYAKGEAKDALNEYRNGQFSTDPKARECVIVAFKGPSIATHAAAFPYDRNPVGDIVFEELSDIPWIADAEMNILPSWWLP